MSPKFNLSNAVTKFIDIEARVDDIENETDNTDDDSQNGFIVGNESPGHPTPEKWLRWNDLIEEDRSSEFFTNLAHSIQNRYCVTPNRPIGLNDTTKFDDLDTHPLALLPTNDDLIFKVKVRVGLERDIVFSILQKSLNSSSTYAVSSAFCRDTIKGYVFVEATSIKAVQNILNGLTGVFRSERVTGPYAIVVVDIHDRHLLLDMRFGNMPPVKPNSWARIKSGRYKRDLALVTGVDLATLTCSILLVPRIDMNNKRKRRTRAPKLLFDAESIRKTFGYNSIEKQDTHWCFKGDMYIFGCLWKDVHMTDLVIEGINASANELQPFYRCGDYWDKAAMHISPIRFGDSIRVISGAFVGLVGEVVEVLDMTVKFMAHGEKEEIREVLTQDVRKEFQIGDFVQVVRGWDRGLEGFLVGLDQRSAVIFVLPLAANKSLERGGKEFVADIADIEWKSNAAIDTPAVAANIHNAHSLYNPTIPHGLPYAPPNPLLELERRTVDRYRNMEVWVIKGEAKGHFGIVKATHKSQEGEDVIEILTYTRAINTMETCHVEDLRERFTKLPIEKACWIPARFRNSRHFEPSSPNASRPSTPLPPSIPTQDLEIHDTSTMRQCTPDIDISPQATSTAGNWLLDRRLLLKKLDIRVQGTTSSHPHWQSGRFEGQLGWVIVTNRVQSVEESVIAKTGFTESRAQLQIRHLVPERTTEIPTYRPSNATPVSILSIPGTRVVIIGPDLFDCMNYIGSYALVAQPPSPPPPNCGLVQIASPGPYWGTYIYLNVSSVCRSSPVPTPINWFGKTIY